MRPVRDTARVFLALIILIIAAALIVPARWIERLGEWLHGIALRLRSRRKRT